MRKSERPSAFCCSFFINETAVNYCSAHLKGLLPITLASILAAGCSSNAAQTTTSETSTAQETTEENSSDSAKDTQKDQDGSRPDQKGRGKNGSEDNKPENGVVHVGDGEMPAISTRKL